MEKTKSLYNQFLEGKFNPIILSIVEKINGKVGEEKFLHDTMLSPKFSVTGKWETIKADYTRVAADWVAPDSELPLKRRDSLAKATGDIAKFGMKMKLNEQQMMELDQMVDLNVDVKTILSKLMEDSAKCISGAKNLLEIAFLEGLSTGVVMISDEDNTGIGIRLDYGYKDENKFTPQFIWEDTENSKPLDDFEKIVEQANQENKPLEVVCMDRKTFKLFRESKQVREYMAGKAMFAGDLSAFPKSTLAEINSRLKDDETFGLTIKIISYKGFVEKNGIRKPVTPWQKGMVVFLPSENVGDLVWANVAEQKHRVEGVTYSTLANGVLLSKFSTNMPTLAEFTQIQGRVVPVINGADGIYQLDTTQTNSDSAEDGNITLWEVQYTKSEVLNAVKEVAEIELPNSTTENAIVQLINTLNKKMQADIKAKLDS